MKINTKKEWKNSKNLFIVDVSAVMRTKYLKLYTESEKRFMGGGARYIRTISYNVDGEEVNTSAMYGLMQLFQMYGVHNDYVFCFDAPNNLLKKIDSNYKNNRVKMGNEYFDQVNTIYKWLTMVGFRTMFKEGYEGDHHIHKAVKENYDIYDNIAIITNDKDLTSLVDDKVVWIDTLKKRPDITKENYEKIVGCPYNMVVLMKSLVGDTSDNIKGVTRFGIKSFEKFIKKEKLDGSKVLGNEREIIQNTEHLKEKQKEQALSCLKLVEPLEVPEDVKALAVPTENVDLFLHKEYLIRYGMTSIDKLFNIVDEF